MRCVIQKDPELTRWARGVKRTCQKDGKDDDGGDVRVADGRRKTTRVRMTGKQPAQLAPAPMFCAVLRTAASTEQSS